ncbi:ATP-grasp peptide maturase system methyltransferase [Haloechinothrix sp. LS1_15]|uniref:ATP-grasp peptide maturase system methyltransferase n=1 Tax=Haloechinothrix sp. LS1_15 TaxID=2652248 RepID=UPI002946BC25|nr:ATP-grasp peptide maturase system methyltransferase [Haloechinothrix sp. LS1_15]MDV6014013.1 methyltransferase domain-containing protein [Haloechinothrix sp. LS1_15]
MTDDWQDRAKALADALVRSGELRSAEWRRAIAGVPRHELVPRYYRQRDDGSWSTVDGATVGRDEWLSTVYSDETLITSVTDTHPRWGTGQIAVSSSTAPGLMCTMLEALDVTDGHTVLEIGTGTGYNAALLCHRLGSEHVYSVDRDGQLVAVARTRLAALGYTPTLVACDGAVGLASHAPYDRIIATCAVGAIPRPWIEQVRDGGLVLADLKAGGVAGNLVLLQRDGDSASGRFLPSWGGFMTMRHDRDDGSDPPRQPRRTRATGSERHTTAPAEPWRYTVPWFLAQLAMPSHLSYGQRIRDDGSAGEIFLSATDGSWCEVASTAEADGSRRVVEAGPASLWTRWETAYADWTRYGRPGWERLGLTVDHEGTHTVSLDHPDGVHRWQLDAGSP